MRGAPWPLPLCPPAPPRGAAMLADRCLLLEGRAGGHWEEAGQGDPCPREPWSPSSQAAGSTPEAPSADLTPQGRGTNPELSRRHSTQPTAHTSSHAHISRHRRQTRRSRENTPPSHGQTHIQTITWAGATGHRQETEVRLKAPKTPEPGKRPAAFCPGQPPPGSLSLFRAMCVTPSNPGQPTLWCRRMEAQA